MYLQRLDDIRHDRHALFMPPRAPWRAPPTLHCAPPAETTFPGTIAYT